MARNIVRKTVELNKEDIAWFEETYPHGSLSAMLQMLLGRFREITIHTPQEYADIAARALSEEITR